MEKPLDQFDFDDFWPDTKKEGAVVARLYSVTEAHHAASRLRAEKIPCFIASEHTNTLMPHLMDYVRLHVRQEDAEEARIILAEINPDWVVNPAAFQKKGQFSGIHAATIAILLVLVLLFLFAVKEALVEKL